MNDPTPDEMVQDLADGLKDVIRGLDENYVKEDPDNAFIDLAARLVLKLKKVAFIPTPSRAEMLRRAEADAAMRIFDILTAWMRVNPKIHCTVHFNSEGKFEFVARDVAGDTWPYPKTVAFFQGESVQDAYAQAAQTIEMNEGAL